MLKRSSELMQAFIDYEVSVLADMPMPHMPTLGDGYEAITRDVLMEDFALPPELNLQVVSGFVSIGGNMLKNQVDCMLVSGVGKRYGRTDNYIYEIEQVLCIFEVKKTLTKAALSDAIKHLADIRKSYSEYFDYKVENENYIPDIGSARTHFAQLTGRDGPCHYYDINKLPIEDAILFYTLVQESLAPVSIIHGYDGYKTEEGLRTAFIDLIEEKINNGDQSFGVPSIPTLITSNEYSLIKTSGTPFIVSNANSEWVTLVSTRFNSAEIILDVVWSKISNYFKRAMPWEDGVYMNNVIPMLIATVGRDSKSVGWIYKTIEPKERKLSREDNVTWEPEKISSIQVSMIQLMGVFGELSLSVDNISYFKNTYSADLYHEMLSLTKTRLFMFSGNALKPINSNTIVLSVEDGTGYVASERDRLVKWCDNNSISGSIMNIIKH
ncbi:DUF6602 domain-containing protein [Enterobacter kobei]|uniref:DUF6602 domain-containing protein n=1 Tax=Enterobacter kobei TaxID=208224 RepID=UPI0020056FC2|nr:hypothetical protein [Enterobacter kobei]